VSAATTTALPVIATGTGGTYSNTVPVWQAQSVATQAPPTARTIRLVVVSGYNGGTAADVIVAPNALYAGPRAINPPPIYLPNNAIGEIITIELMLEATTIQWASGNTGGGILMLGWTDQVP